MNTSPELRQLVEAMDQAESLWWTHYSEWCENGKGRMPILQEYRADVALKAAAKAKQIADDAIESWHIESKLCNKLELENDALKEALEYVVAVVIPTTPAECDAIAEAKALL